MTDRPETTRVDALHDKAKEIHAYLNGEACGYYDGGTKCLDCEGVAKILAQPISPVETNALRERVSKMRCISGADLSHLPQPGVCLSDKCNKCSLLLLISEMAQHISAAPVDAESLAKQFHESYERLAPSFGYETRKASAKPWSEVPENNRKLMIAVCAEMGQHISAAVEAAYERAAQACVKNHSGCDKANVACHVLDEEAIRSLSGGTSALEPVCGCDESVGYLCDRHAAERNVYKGASTVKISLADWLEERLQNCLRIADLKEGEIRDGWLEDAEYFRMAIAATSALELERLEARRDALEQAALIADKHWPESGHEHQEGSISCQMTISVHIRRERVKVDARIAALKGER